MKIQMTMKTIMLNRRVNTVKYVLAVFMLVGCTLSLSSIQAETIFWHIGFGSRWRHAVVRQPRACRFWGDCNRHSWRYVRVRPNGSEFVVVRHCNRWGCRMRREVIN